MKDIAFGSIVAMLVTILSGCVTPAPGADQVKITRNPADVSACSPVGNINPEAMNNLDPHVAQNRAVGLNANVVLNTGNGGVAYHCGNSVAAQQK
jgi:hypothetical protein